MTHMRPWSISYFNQPNGSYQRPFNILLKCSKREGALHFESGSITELEETDYKLIENQFTKLEDVFACLGVYESATYNKILKLYPSYLVVVTECQQVGQLRLYEVYRINNVRFLCLNKQGFDDESNNELKKLLSSGAFYLAKENATGMPYDLTRSAQSHFRLEQDRGLCSTFGTYDQRFLWNRGLMAIFSQKGIKLSDWLHPIVCGSFHVATLYVSCKLKLGIVSRVSTLRPGTRFNVRGVDDNGYVANFVETEVFIQIEDRLVSHVQIRGTVPLFWEQPGLQFGSHKIRIVPLGANSLQAFNRHFSEILSRYGETAIVNLMGSKDGEVNLSRVYHEHLRASDYQATIPYTHFDYHAAVSSGNPEGLNSLLYWLEERVKVWGFFYFDGEEVKRLQSGTARINCVDCLDRTNAVQMMISIKLVWSQFLQVLGDFSGSRNSNDWHEEKLQSMWQENGDNVSRIYTGTGALGTDRSKLKNVQRSATRAIKNNFFDGAKQEAMVSLINHSSLIGWQRLVTGQFLPQRLNFLPQSVLQSILERNADFTRRERLRVFIGTWNVNGGRQAHSSDLTDWILRRSEGDSADKESSRPIDIYAIGFEEIIDLNAGNIVAGKQNSENKQQWGSKLQDLLDLSSETGEPFVLLCTTQMVGVCIFVFIRLGLCEHVRELTSASVKTGLHGKTGNKGAVAVRFLIGATSLCFCCSHLTAGQSAFRERNTELSDISERLLLPPDKRTLLTHDYVFWFGDLNYRIDLPNDVVRRHISRCEWPDLLSRDQLTVQRNSNAIFEGFHEGRIDFPPTYKYNPNSNEYDTSEKARCPAWTDRILWRRAKLTFKKSSIGPRNGGCEQPVISTNLLAYYRSNVSTSDHRPVAAIFDIDIQVVELARRRQVMEEELLSAGPGDATACVRWICNDAPTSVSADRMYQSIMGLVGQMGTTILTRFRGTDQLLLTFSTPYEAMNAVKFLNGYTLPNDPVKLSAFSESAPGLGLCEKLHGFSAVLRASVLDQATRNWITEMNSVLEIAEEEDLKTHGPPITLEKFQPSVVSPEFRRQKNLMVDRELRQKRVTILANDDQSLINLWDDDEFKCGMPRKTENSGTVAPPPRPTRPPRLMACTVFPDSAAFKALSTAPSLTHVHSCSDLPRVVSETCSLDLNPYRSTQQASSASPSPPIQQASAHVSPQHVPPSTIPDCQLPRCPQPLIDFSSSQPVIASHANPLGRLLTSTPVEAIPLKSSFCLPPPLTPQKVPPPVPYRRRPIEDLISKWELKE